MTRIVFITTGLSVGGAEKMLLKLLSHINRENFTPLVISLTTKGEIGLCIESLGIPVKALFMTQNMRGVFKFFSLVRLLRECQPDIVQTWMYHADLFGGLAARVLGIKLLSWGIRHSDLSPDKNKRSTLRVVSFCAKLSKWVPREILSCSDRAVSAHISAGYCAEKFRVIPNGFDLDRFAPDMRAKCLIHNELKLGMNVLLVGMIARFHPQKNHKGFIEAAAEVALQYPDAHFLLAGMGVDANNQFLVNLIEKTGASERFHLMGQRNDISSLMAALDLLVSSSWGEAFPNVLGEAMACGVPCVVTDAGDSAEIVGETGRVVQPVDTHGLAQNIAELLDDSELRSELGIKARERVREYYEIRRITLQYENFYNNMLRAI